MVCARIVTTPKEEPRKLTYVLIQTGLSTLKEFARTVTSVLTIESREYAHPHRKSKILLITTPR
jgi:hypothetical protein